MNRKTVIGHLCAASTIMIWGSTFIFTQILLQEMSPVEILFYRFLVGYLVLWILRPRTFRTGSVGMELRFALAGLTGIALNYYCESAALLYTSAAVVCIIVSSAPFLVGLVATLILKQRLPRFFVPGFAVAIAGIAIVSFADNTGAESGVRFLGQILAFGACVTWTVYSLLSERINEQGYDEILVSRRLFFYGLLAIAPFYLRSVDLGHVRLLMQPTNLGCILFLGIGACALSFITWNRAIAILGTVTTNVYVYLLPIVPILLSFLVFREPVTPALIAGVILAIAGLMLSVI